MLIGLTGGIGTGKSTVARMLAERGARVLDADELAHRVIEPDGSVYRAVVELVGPDGLDRAGRICRDRLRESIFQDPGLRRRLEAIVHPAVLRGMEEEIHRLREDDPSGWIVCEVPLLFEAGLADRFDRVIVVTADPVVQARRLAARDGAGPGRSAEIASQLPLAEKVARADDVIDNSGPMDQTRRQVDEMVARWEPRSRP